MSRRLPDEEHSKSKYHKTTWARVQGGECLHSPYAKIYLILQWGIRLYIIVIIIYIQDSASWGQIYVIFISICLILRSSVIILWKRRKGERKLPLFLPVLLNGCQSHPYYSWSTPTHASGLRLSQRLSLTTSKKWQYFRTKLT